MRDDIYEVYAESVETKIKKCPFCGAAAHYEDGKLVIKCTGCGACIKGSSQQDVVERWNKRI